MSFLFQVKIDSVDVSNFVRPFEILEQKDNNITTVKLEFIKNIEAAVTLQQLKRIEIWRGITTATDTKVFDGFITNVKTDGLKYIVMGGDKLYRAVNANVNQIYALTSPQAGVISEIFLDLINTYTLLTANSSTVQDSGLVNVLEKFKLKRKSVYESCKNLADALGWQFYYRSDTDLVYFEPKGVTINSNTITVGAEIISLPKWEEDNSEYFNDIYVAGAPLAVSYTDEYTADGIDDSFSITKGTPISVEVLVDGVVKKGGITTATTDAEYLIDSDARLITFTTGNIPTAAQIVTINYSYYISLATHAYRQTSIDKYGETVTRPFTFTEIKTMADLKQKAQALLDLHTTPFLQAPLKIGAQFVNDLGLRVGQQIRVVDTQNMIEGATIDRDFIILSRKMRFPSDYDEIVVGDKEWKLGDWEAGVEERLQKLVDEANETEEILLEIVDLPGILTFKRSTLTITRYFINDSFIREHGINGVMYNVDETDIYDDFETSGDWTPSGTASGRANDTVSTHYWVGSQGMEVTFSGAGAGAVTNTVTSKNNLSNVVGVTTGTPTQGTAGVWLYSENNPLSAISLRIGSSSVNRIQVLGKTFAQVTGNASTFGLTNSQRTLILFDLDSPTSTTGTPAWSNPSYCAFILTATGSGTVTMDYHTYSKNNSLSLNGMGNRITEKNSITFAY